MFPHAVQYLPNPHQPNGSNGVIGTIRLSIYSKDKYERNIIGRRLTI